MLLYINFIACRKNRQLQHAFNGDFDKLSQSKLIPRHIKGIVNMLLSELNVKSNEIDTQSSLTISQVQIFNLQPLKRTVNILIYRIGRATALDFMIRDSRLRESFSIWVKGKREI